MSVLRSRADECEYLLKNFGEKTISTHQHIYQHTTSNIFIYEIKLQLQHYNYNQKFTFRICRKATGRPHDENQNLIKRNIP